MIRELFHLGPLSLSPFGVMLMLAFLAAYAQLAWGLRTLEAGDADDASTLMLWAGLAGIVGGKVYYAALYHDWHLLFDRSGLVWYGGFAAGLLAAGAAVSATSRTTEAAAEGVAAFLAKREPVWK